jgi:methylmalonyl-CoA/ethylmalonyl-CoA epimerase
MTPSTIALGPLRQVSLHAIDVGRAVAFYRDVLGLRLLATYGEGLAFFDLAGTRLMIEGGDGSPPPAGSVLYLEVPDVRAAYAQLQAAGVTFEDEPHMIFRDDAGTFGPAGGEEWMTFFRDTEGNLLAIAGRHGPD